MKKIIFLCLLSFTVYSQKIVVNKHLVSSDLYKSQLMYISSLDNEFFYPQKINSYDSKDSNFKYSFTVHQSSKDLECYIYNDVISYNIHSIINGADNYTKGTLTTIGNDKILNIVATFQNKTNVWIYINSKLVYQL